MEKVNLHPGLSFEDIKNFREPERRLIFFNSNEDLKLYLKGIHSNYINKCDIIDEVTLIVPNSLKVKEYTSSLGIKYKENCFETGSQMTKFN